MWNAQLAGIVFQHPTVESLLRELRRNWQLRQVCGFEPIKGLNAVPNSWAFSRFAAKVIGHLPLIEAMFPTLVDQLTELLPDFGARLAIDGKALASFARGKSEKEYPDGRGDSDGEWGIHEYRGTHADGTAWQTVKKRFGYTIHLLVDSQYELPVDFSVTRANASEVLEAHKVLDGLEERHPGIVQRCQEFTADRSSDDGEATKLVTGFENVVYDYRGTVICVCPQSGTQRQMAYGGISRIG